MPNNFDLPEWVDMGDSPSLDISPFIGALRKRMQRSSPVDLGGGSTFTPGGTGTMRPRMGAMGYADMPGGADLGTQTPQETTRAALSADGYTEKKGLGGKMKSL